MCVVVVDTLADESSRLRIYEASNLRDDVAPTASRHLCGEGVRRAAIDLFLQREFFVAPKSRMKLKNAVEIV